MEEVVKHMDFISVADSFQLVANSKDPKYKKTVSCLLTGCNSTYTISEIAVAFWIFVF